MSRSVEKRYRDPLELVWLHAANQLGMCVHRSDEVYASWDGVRTLTLGTPDILDADDSMAQMVLHELCHALIAGPDGWHQVDWGFEPDHLGTPWEALREHAAVRLQAALADAWGLRGFFSVTTDWRHYYDALPPDPLSGMRDRSRFMARQGWVRGRTSPYRSVLDNALAATARIAQTIAPAAPDDSLWGSPSDACPTRHPLGFALSASHLLRCGGCAWGSSGTCRMAADEGSVGPQVRSEQIACVHWERALVADDCASCAACCRGGFGAVVVDSREPLHRVHPELITDDGWGPHLARPNGNCVALTSSGGRHRCRVYEHRPTSCRDFEVGGQHCVTARIRTGLSGRD